MSKYHPVSTTFVRTRSAKSAERSQHSSAAKRAVRRGGRPTRWLMAAALLAVAGTSAGCSMGDGAERRASTPDATVAEGQAPKATTEQAQAPAEDLTAEVARPSGDVSVLDAPNGAEIRSLPATTEFGSQRALLITSTEPGWLQVLVPGRPNGVTGWIPEEGVEVTMVDMRITVDLAARTLSVVTPAGPVLESPVAIGSSEAPTPTGRFSITDKLATGNSDGAYGPFALGLSGRSEVLTEFAGGDGQVGIHGTNDPSSIGKDVSHGCVRVPNEVIGQLNDLVPLGTPVVIV